MDAVRAAVLLLLTLLLDAATQFLTGRFRHRHRWRDLLNRFQRLGLLDALDFCRKGVTSHMS